MADIFKRYAPIFVFILTFICVITGIASNWSELQKTPTKGVAYDPQVRFLGMTTNTTPTTIFTIPVGADGDVIRVIIDMIGKSGTNVMSGTKKATIKRVSGALSVVGLGVQDAISGVQDAGLAAASWTISTSGTDIIVSVTGISGTVNWSGNVMLLTKD